MTSGLGKKYGFSDPERPDGVDYSQFQDPRMLQFWQEQVNNNSNPNSDLQPYPANQWVGNNYVYSSNYTCHNNNGIILLYLTLSTSYKQPVHGLTYKVKEITFLQ